MSLDLYSVLSCNRNFYSAPLNDGEWHSVCITWQKSAGICTAYIDGKTNKRRTFSGCKSNTDFKLKGKPLVLGQSMLSDGTFQANNSFTGNISRMNMWDYAMGKDEVYHLATNGSNLVGNIVSWPHFRDVLEGNVVRTEGSLCNGPGKLREHTC